ncbi:MAG: DNA phosphorothioation system sulfurtransferase DndC [Ruminococcus flavefaciens]|nr:DNA phosphorothioation system sulfurtransferase DndC [Ruminococcus flavefaciens]
MATNSYFNENTLEELIEEIKYVYQSDNRPWVIGYSGGKDSTAVVELVYKMLLTLPVEQRKKNVYIVSSDTLIENPLIKIYLSKMNEMLGTAAARDGLPIRSAMVTPSPSNSFWANVIGRGLPTPRMNGTFRWCTDRLKINPSADYIREVIRREGEEVVVLLGVRKEESIARKRRIEGRELANRLMNRHETIQDAYVYNPIVELTTDDVWDVLLCSDGGKTPWGSDNNELVSLYGDADSGECPFAGESAGIQTQSCGNSRFGCWVCTVVKEDKSLNGFIKSGHRELQPLADFRKWIMGIRDKDEYREKKRRNGTVYETKTGEMGYGPFTWEARQIILTKLLDTQKKMGYELITLEELKAIDEIWDTELDFSRRTLVELYERLTGEKLPWYQYKEPLIDAQTVNELEKLAAQNDVPFDLVRNIILSVYHNKNYSNRKIMKEEIEKLLNQQWLHYDILKEIEDDNQQGHTI